MFPKRKYLSLMALCLVFQMASSQGDRKIALVIHGGEGTILKSSMTPKKEAAYKARLETALQKGYTILVIGDYLPPIVSNVSGLLNNSTKMSENLKQKDWHSF